MSALINLSQVKEILQLLSKAPSHDPGQIWQSQEQLRQVYNITKLEHDTTQKALVIESLLEFDFSSEFPVFVRINHRDLIFKLNPKECVIEDNKLICHYPQLAKAIENRQQIRITAPPSEAIAVVIREAGGNGAEIKTLMNDFSKSGLGIFAGSGKGKFFYRNDIRFQLISIGSINFAKPIIMVMKHHRTLDHGSLQAGFKLEQPFSDETFQVITSVILGRKI